VFDLGGGTFDVTVLEHFEGVMEVKASSGDGHLGGEDFTEATLRLLCREAGIDATVLTAPARKRLRYFAEAAKRKLSDAKGYKFEFEMDGTSYSADLDADAFEAEVAPLVKRMRKPLHRCLYDADGVEREIDRVILVGGATRMPLARKMVARELRIFPDGGIDPDHAVALGAAVHVGLIAEDRALEDVVMTDVSPFSIGIGTSQGDDQHRVRDLFLPIIPRNTALPASREERVAAVHLDQREIIVRVFQGESAHVGDNILLGTLNIPVPPDPYREFRAKLDVRITQDVSGLVEVTGRIDGSKKVHRLLVETNATELTAEEIERRMAALDHLKIYPAEDEDNKAVVMRIKRLYEMAEMRDREFLRDMLVSFELLMQGQDPKAIEKARTRIKAQLDSIDEIYVS
jgi:molecular chaperone HscC